MLVKFHRRHTTRKKCLKRLLRETIMKIRLRSTGWGRTCYLIGPWAEGDGGFWDDAQVSGLDTY